MTQLPSWRLLVPSNLKRNTAELLLLLRMCHQKNQKKNEAFQFEQEAGDAQGCFEAHGDARVNEVVADQTVTLDQTSVIGGNSVLTPMCGDQPKVELDRGT